MTPTVSTDKTADNSSVDPYSVVEADLTRDRATIIALWRAGLTQHGAPEVKFDWYYLRKTQACPRVYLLCHGAAATPVGVAAIGLRHMRFGTDLIFAGALVDFVAVAEHRTLFPAMRLQKTVLQRGLENHSILYGLPNPKSLGIVHRAGYTRVGMMTRFAMMLRTASYLSRHMPSSMSHLVGPLIDWSRALFRATRQLGAPSFKTRWLNQADEHFDALWERTSTPNLLVGVRNASFLNWRFTSCSISQYVFFTVYDEKTEQLLAYAACDIGISVSEQTTSQSANKRAPPTLHVRDFFVASDTQRVATSLWHLLAREAHAKGYGSISVEFHGASKITQTLMRSGLRPRESRPLYAAVTENLKPQLQSEFWYLTNADEDW
jgi:hypothetical protein